MREAMRAVLVPVLAKDGRQRVLVESIEDICGGDAASPASIHPHVQRRILAEGEPPARIVDLVGRYPEVEQDARKLLLGQLGDLVDLRKVAEVGSESAIRGVGRESFTHGVEGIGV